MPFHLALRRRRRSTNLPAHSSQSDIKRPSSPGTPSGSSSFAVARPHGANAVRCVAPSPSLYPLLYVLGVMRVLTFVLILPRSVARPHRVSLISPRNSSFSPLKTPLLPNDMNDIAPDATPRASSHQPTHPPTLSLLAPSLHLLRPTRSRRAAAPPRPSSARAAGAGGSSNTMLKLYTDSGEAGLKVYVDSDLLCRRKNTQTCAHSSSLCLPGPFPLSGCSAMGRRVGTG